VQEQLQAELDELKQHEDKLSYEVQHYKSVLSDTVRIALLSVTSYAVAFKVFSAKFRRNGCNSSVDEAGSV